MGITFGDHLIDSGYREPEEEPMPVEKERDLGEDCGRWDQNAKGGMLPYYWCRLAGTEFCDWDCPFAMHR